MTSLPSGTVTFLFTDIEGSTKFAQQYPDQWESLRARHHSILQSAMDSHNGYVFQIIGDAFCVAFRTASDGLHAAIEAQHNLQCEDWGDTPIKVRMGLHTGSAELRGTDYRGYLTMAKVQRIMSLAYGGQVLISNTSADLLHQELPVGVALRDLKEHRLKGLPDPEHLWQIVSPQLQPNFPPLQSLNEIPHNLPLQLSSFIGREKEVGEIKKQLQKNRLITLTGSGGVGKTRLSIQVASELLEEYPNGVWLVELAPITDPVLVTQTVCSALDVTPQGNISPLAVLTDYLKAKRILLVVDNCEHLIDASAQLCHTLLQACPQVRIIASSREALGIEGEKAYRVPSLSLPAPSDGVQTIGKSEAVRLFVERATAVLPEFEITEANGSAIVQICQRLDGIALAIELAASRVKVLSVEQIAARLDDAFRLLTGGSRTALPRQQTLRALVDWSYNLLTEEERTVLRSLSVFVGGWTLEAAEYVCDNPNMLEMLTHLVDKSLVAVDLGHGDEPRYYLLETIRQYAREKLAESREGERARTRHLKYFLLWVERENHHIYGTGQVEWLQKLEEEHENLTAALEWSLPGNVPKGQRLMAALWWSWHESGHNSETFHWLERMLAATPGEESLVVAELLSGVGWLAEKLEDNEKLNEKSVEMFRKLDDEAGAAFPLCSLGIYAYWRTDYERAIERVEESLTLFKAAGNQWGVRHVMGILGYIAEAQGDFTKAQEYYEKSLSISKEIGDLDGVAWTLYLMGRLGESQGDPELALRKYEEALRMERIVKTKPLTSWILDRMGVILLKQGDYEQCRSKLEESLDINQRAGNRRGVSYVLNRLGRCLHYQGDEPKARSHLSSGLKLIKEAGDPDDIAYHMLTIGALLGTQGYPAKFARLFGFAEKIFPDTSKLFMTPPRAEVEQYPEIARGALGETTYAAAYESGKQLDLDEAVAYALKELGQ